jgi:small conductance mechanosensitive channel
MFGMMGFDFSGATATLQAMGAKLSERLPYFLIALVIFFFFFWLSKRIRNATTQILLRRSLNNHNTAVLIGRTASGAIVATGAFIAMAFAVPNFTPSHLVSIFGFISVTLGIAFRDVLSNLLAGIFILYTEPFRIGDSISTSGFEGTVENIQTRATLLKTPEGKRVVIPNSLLYNAPVLVNSAYDYRRVEITLRVHLDNDLQLVEQKISEAINKIAGILESPKPEVALTELAAEGATFTIRFWIDTNQKLNITSAKNAALIQIKAAFEQAEIFFVAPPANPLETSDSTELDSKSVSNNQGLKI